jgi:hypothetical protein
MQSGGSERRTVTLRRVCLKGPERGIAHSRLLKNSPVLKPLSGNATRMAISRNSETRVMKNDLRWLLGTNILRAERTMLHDLDCLQGHDFRPTSHDCIRSLTNSSDGVPRTGLNSVAALRWPVAT